MKNLKMCLAVIMVTVLLAAFEGCKKDNSVTPVKATTFHAEVRDNPDSLSGGQHNPGN